MEARVLDELQNRYGLERTAAALAEHRDREGQPSAYGLASGCSDCPGRTGSSVADSTAVEGAIDLVRSKCRPAVKQIRQRVDVEALKKAA
jgi:hypothetical protein